MILKKVEICQGEMMSPTALAGEGVASSALRKPVGFPESCVPARLSGRLQQNTVVFGDTLWLFNIAMENCPFIDFIDGLPIKNCDFPWLC